MTLKATTLARTRSDSYLVERMLHADPEHATAYRRAMQILKPYPSAIIFPETLMLLPIVPGRKRVRRVYAVDLTIAGQDDDAGAKPRTTQVKIREINFSYLRTADRAGDDGKFIIYRSAQRVLEADLADESLSMPTPSGEYVAIRLEYHLPRVLLPQGMIHHPQFAMDALFGDLADALRYQQQIAGAAWEKMDIAPAA